MVSLAAEIPCQSMGLCTGGCRSSAAARHSKQALGCPGASSQAQSQAAVWFCRPEELRLRPQGLRKFLDKVRACAADQGAHQLLQRRATEFAAFLRFREKVWTAQCCSCSLLMASEYSEEGMEYNELLTILSVSFLAVMLTELVLLAVTWMRY